MAQIELKYTIPYQGGGTPQNGSIVDIVLTYDENAVAGTSNGVNYYLATAATGTYQVLGAGNTVLRTDTITGLSPVGTVGGNDNYIRPTASPIIQSGAGVSFTVNVQTDGGYRNGTTNVYRQGTQLFDGGSNSSAATNVSSNPVCFATGTRIRTTRGDVVVEDLQIGDLVVTASGAHRPIRWIGRRLTHCNRHPQPRKVWPVRIAADTFGADLPYADLWLSPGHALCLDGHLVPVRGLIDGRRIVQVEQDTVTYWHVELDTHDVLVANGLPAESYLDTGNRRAFDNAEVTAQHFDVDPAPGYDGSGYCLPMIVSGRELTVMRARYGLGRTASKVAAEQIPSDVRLVADGVLLVPFQGAEDELRFLVPAGTSDLRLSSPSFVGKGDDNRRLGVIVNGVEISDGSAWRAIPLDDPSLYAGFHDLECEGGQAWRWTDGEGHLSPSSWPELSGVVQLRLSGKFTGLVPATSPTTMMVRVDESVTIVSPPDAPAKPMPLPSPGGEEIGRAVAKYLMRC